MCRITWLKDGEAEDEKKSGMTDDKTFVIENLTPETTYIITLQASTSEFTSEPTIANFATGNGGEGFTFEPYHLFITRTFAQCQNSKHNMPSLCKGNYKILSIFFVFF